MVVCKNIPSYQNIHDIITLPDYANIHIKKYTYYAHLDISTKQIDGNYFSRRDEGGSHKIGLTYSETNGVFSAVTYSPVAELDIFIEYTKII